jgi:hypothetical protein
VRKTGLESLFLAMLQNLTVAAAAGRIDRHRCDTCKKTSNIRAEEDTNGANGGDREWWGQQRMAGTVYSFRARSVLAATRPFRQQLPVMAEIFLREEHLLAAVAALRDVVRVSRQDHPRQSCHTVPP